MPEGKQVTPTYLLSHPSVPLLGEILSTLYFSHYFSMIFARVQRTWRETEG